MSEPTTRARVMEEARRMLAEGRPVNRSEVARRLGVGHQLVSWHLRWLRAAGWFPAVRDMGCGRRRFGPADRAAVVALAGRMGGRRPTAVAREFAALTGRRIGVSTVRDILEASS